MTCFVVSYDLRKKGEFDYQKLWDEFDRLGGVKTQESVYFINLNNTTKEVLDHFKQFVHDNDLLFAVKMASKPLHTKALTGTNAWIAEHFPD